jgi:hypothetical protein
MDVRTSQREPERAASYRMRTNSLFLCAASLLACGGIPFATSAAEAAGSGELSAPPLYRPLTLGLEGGTTGLGGFLSWRFSDHLGARAGLDYFEYSQSDFGIKSLDYDAKVRLMSEPLTLDIYPWKKHSFHISLGVQFNQNRLTGTAEDDGTLIPPAKLGKLSLELEQQLVNPYLGIGGNFLYFDRAHHWALGGELGVAYTGEPKGSLNRAGPPAPLFDAAGRAEEKRVQDYADQFKWWPVAKLMVTYSF